MYVCIYDVGTFHVKPREKNKRKKKEGKPPDPSAVVSGFLVIAVKTFTLVGSGDQGELQFGPDNRFLGSYASVSGILLGRPS